MAAPKTIKTTSPDGKDGVDFILNDKLHNGMPVWDLAGSIHHSLCWHKFDNSEYGFWATANLHTLDEDGQATGVVFETPEVPIGDGPVGLPTTATKSQLPPPGWWTRGRPWAGDRTSGGRQMKLSW
jgi:hypothetical protein